MFLRFPQRLLGGCTHIYVPKQYILHWAAEVLVWIHQSVCLLGNLFSVYQYFSEDIAADSHLLVTEKHSFHWKIFDGSVVWTWSTFFFNITNFSHHHTSFSLMQCRNRNVCTMCFYNWRKTIHRNLLFSYKTKEHEIFHQDVFTEGLVNLVVDV